MAVASLAAGTSAAEVCRNYTVAIAEARHSCIEVAAVGNLDRKEPVHRLEHLEACQGLQR